MKITLPENISEITLGQLQELDVLDNRTDLSDKDKVIRKVKIFTGLSFKQVSATNYSDLEWMIKQIDKALEEESKFETTFSVNGVEFGFIPNFDDIQAKEFFDLTSYNDKIEELHKLMSILYRPINVKDYLGNYTIKEYQGSKEWAEAMKQTPLNIVNGALGFFLTLSQDCKSHTLKSMAKETVRKGKAQQTTTLNGDGIALSTN